VEENCPSDPRKHTGLSFASQYPTFGQLLLTVRQIGFTLLWSLTPHPSRGTVGRAAPVCVDEPNGLPRVLQDLHTEKVAHRGHVQPVVVPRTVAEVRRHSGGGIAIVRSDGRGGGGEGG
jgi:hypothetical protein